MAIIKKKVPAFKRQNRHKIRVVKSGWRKPRGIDNKQRISKKGFGPLPRIGYGQNRKIRGMHPSGTLRIIIENAKALDALPKGATAMIAGKVGARKRIAIIAAAKAKGIKLA